MNKVVFMEMYVAWRVTDLEAVHLSALCEHWHALVKLQFVNCDESLGWEAAVQFTQAAYNTLPCLKEVLWLHMDSTDESSDVRRVAARQTPAAWMLKMFC